MNNKYFFYNEKGEVYLIYSVEPPEELKNNNFIVAEEAPQKQGFNIVYSVNLSTKELKVNYKTIPENLETKVSMIQNMVNTLMMEEIK